MGITLTDEQNKLIKDAVRFVHNTSDQVFQYTAPAGAGKSTVMHAIVDALGYNDDCIAPMAYTGAAAIVMRLNGFTTAATIHSWLYTPEKEYRTNEETGKIESYTVFKFVPLSKERYKLILIDEGSMVPMHMLKDLLANDIKIIVAGDLNQLPPVKDTPAFLYSGEIHYLTQIMRQNKNSSIVELSRMLSQGILLRPGEYGDVTVIYRDQITPEMIKSVDTIICGTNKTRDYYNDYIRRELLHTSYPLPLHGERLVCRQNDWSTEVDGINLANGLSGRVSSYPSMNSFKNNKFIINFTPDLFPDITFYDLKCDYKYFTANYQKRREMKEMKNFKDPTNAEKFEFAYCITTHISQGSQFMNGMYIQEYLNPNINNNLNYTGITRFRRSCIYVLPETKYKQRAWRYVISRNGKPY